MTKKKEILAHTFFNKKLAPLMDALNQRWRDEQEYEQWEEYEADVKKLFDKRPGIVFEKVVKSPFAVHFSCGDIKYVARCRARKIELLQIH